MRRQVMYLVAGILLVVGAYGKGYLDGLDVQGAHVTALRQGLDTSTATLTAANAQLLKDIQTIEDLLPTIEACARIAILDEAMPREPEFRVEE